VLSCVVKYSVQHAFMTLCLHKLVRVCLAVISLTAFSHRIFKHNTIGSNIFYMKISDNTSFFSVAVRICSHSSYLLGFIDTFT